MSYETTRAAFGILNDELNTRYENGDPVRFIVDGRPKLRVLSFTPFACEEYGFFRNRAPYIAGSVALRTFITAPHVDGGALILAGVEAGIKGYGFELDGYDPAILAIAKQLGHPEIRPTQAK